MHKGLIAAALAGMVLFSGVAASAPDAEPAVGVDLRAANWPADVVRLVARDL